MLEGGHNFLFPASNNLDGNCADKIKKKPLDM